MFTPIPGNWAQLQPLQMSNIMHFMQDVLYQSTCTTAVTLTAAYLLRRPNIGTRPGRQPSKLQFPPVSQNTHPPQQPPMALSSGK